MINPKSPSEQLLFSTLRIEAGKSVGTGFFYTVQLNENTQLPLIITNKHVVAGSEVISFGLHEGKQEDNQNVPSGKYLKVNYQSRWVDHPDKDVDLCATPLQPLVNQIKKGGGSVFYITLSEELIWTDTKLEELSAVEDILMVGYPIGLWDHINNLPLIRRGVTSTHPAINFQGENIGVADIAVFPGSSGSPVLIVNEGSYGTRTGLSLGSRAILLGVLQSGPTFNTEGDIVIRDIPTTKNQLAASMRTMINLGYYIKAKEIIKLGEECKKHFYKQAVPEQAPKV